MALINTQTRTGTGKGVSRQLRREAKIPAILYGGGQPNVNLFMDAKEWNMLVAKERSSLRTKRQEMLIDNSNRVPVLLRSCQIHPLSGDTIHIDFTRFDPTQKIELFVPVAVLDEELCPGIKEGGVLQVVRHELEISCMAKDVPNAIEISVKSLQIGHSIHIEDIQLPPGVEVHTDVNFTILAIISVKGEAAPEEEETVE